LFFEAWEVSSLEHLPDRNNLVAATEQRLNVNITIARSGARFAASLCALLTGGVTFDGSTKDAVQCDVRDALVVLKAATAQAQAEATKEAQRVGIAHAKANGGARALQSSEAELQP
jgi:paraquat-inducible protein B